MPWNQYQCDLAEPASNELAIEILKQGELMVYALGPKPPYLRADWTLFRLDCAQGSCDRSRQSYPSFIEATRAYRTGAVIWGE
jgi:hypothetical protein